MLRRVDQVHGQLGLDTPEVGTEVTDGVGSGLGDVETDGDIDGDGDTDGDVAGDVETDGDGSADCFARHVRRASETWYTARA